MTITHKLTLDLQRKGEMPRIDVVQGDAFTRQVDLVLENGGKPWLFPICEPVARYCKPDGTMGVYDTLPTGAPAFSYAGNMLTLVLAPQMLTCPGVVQVQVEMNDQELKLATFTFLVVVEPGVALYGESEDYVNWTKAFLPQTTGAKVGQYLQISKVDDAGRITEMAPAENSAVEATNKAYEALRIANDVAQEIKAYSPSGTRSIAEEAMRRANSRLVAPQSASVGQYFRVKEVDANGVVTAVEAVDVPVSGGSADLSGYATEQFVQDGFQPKGDYLESSALTGAVNTALEQAKASGEFDGADGKTPLKGVDYFTEADKQEIAEQAAELVDFPSGGEGAWKKIVDFSITEEVSSFSVNQDLWGNAINIFEQEALIFCIAVPTASNDSKKSTTFLINGRHVSSIQNALYGAAWNSRRSLRIGQSPWTFIDVEKTWYYGTGTDSLGPWMPAADPKFGWNECIPELAGTPINSVGYYTDGVFGIGSKIVVYVKG